MKRVGISVAALAVMVSGAWAQPTFFEIEPNDSKALANIVPDFGIGGTYWIIQGNSLGSTGVNLDYFDIRMATAPLGIYRHRLVITTAGTVGHTGTIRGLSQTAAPPDTLPGIPWDGVVGTPILGGDAAPQTSSTATVPPRFNQWYGFGRGERLYYRVTGTTSTTLDYVATLETVPVTPTIIPGMFEPGLITINFIGQGHTTDTDIWVYDSDFNAITGYGNDDASGPLGGAPVGTSSTQSWLARIYAPGVYYLAVTNFNLASNMCSPSDDNFRTGALVDFGDLVLNSSTTTGLTMTFTIADDLGYSQTVFNTKAGPYDINWFQFTVIPEPAALVLLVLGGLLAARRPR